ncbi:uncharacterized protein [Fopius arisanus]|uniref:SmpB protein n=1 Tax=Fopius arisanus TaxID=64838 RepID=A0A0C9QMT6_9HYME|nr:PREDICTED: uncharacterized protein LOC105267322 [Fopius arisanus]
MKALSDVKRSKDLKRKRDDSTQDVRLDKQIKVTDFDTNSSINLDNNVDESAGFFDEYCQILLKDSNQSQGNVIDDDLLGDKGREIFSGMSDQMRAPLAVRLKGWAVRNGEALKNEVIDDLLTILRDEGYLDLPGTAVALLGGEGSSSAPKAQDDPITEGELERVDIWIKKEESSESMWANDDNNSSEPLSHDEIESSIRSDVICPDFAVTDFISDDPKGKTGEKSEENGGKFSSAFKEELQKMEQRWARQLESTKRSLLYDMVRKYEDLKNRIGVSTRPLGTSFTDDKEILGVKLPFLNVDTFREFDDSIGDNPEKEIAMKSLMTTLCFGAASLSNSIGCILSAFLTKDVQMQYSACGKKIRGVKKRNFGDTNTFRYAKDVLREKHGTSDAEIVSKTSRWFTGAGDRDGGRKERRKENPNHSHLSDTKPEISQTIL